MSSHFIHTIVNCTMSIILKMFKYIIHYIVSKIGELGVDKICNLLFVNKNYIIY